MAQQEKTRQLKTNKRANDKNDNRQIREPTTNQKQCLHCIGYSRYSEILSYCSNCEVMCTDFYNIEKNGLARHKFSEWFSAED